MAGGAVEEFDLQTEQFKPQKRWPLLRLITLLVTVLLVFGAGVAVGRQNSNAKQPGASNSSAINYSSVNQVYSLLKQDFDGSLDQTKLLDGLKGGLVTAAGDPYTTYFNPKQAQSFEEQLAGSFSGIGAELGSDKDNHIVIVSPLAGYPADKAGLKPKDIVAGVNGHSTDGWSVYSATQKIRGQAGTTVKLTIVRDGGQAFDVSITRAKITIPSVKSKVDGQIGYMKLSQFTDDTVSLTQKAAKNFVAKGVKAVVLDLRGNPGGFLDGAVRISSLWLDNGTTVVQERRGSEVVSTETAAGDNILKGLPTVVLIDSGSASASEILAGALRDNHAATLLGIKSFGKGSVQKVEKLDDGSEIKITMARWYTPAGKNIDKQGIEPDVIVKISPADQKAGRDPQKAKAYQILRSKIH